MFYPTALVSAFLYTPRKSRGEICASLLKERELLTRTEVDFMEMYVEQTQKLRELDCIESSSYDSRNGLEVVEAFKFAIREENYSEIHKLWRTVLVMREPHAIIFDIEEDYDGFGFKFIPEQFRDTLPLSDKLQIAFSIIQNTTGNTKLGLALARIMKGEDRIDHQSFRLIEPLMNLFFGFEAYQSEAFIPFTLTLIDLYSRAIRDAIERTGVVPDSTSWFCYHPQVVSSLSLGGHFDAVASIAINKNLAIKYRVEGYQKCYRSYLSELTPVERAWQAQGKIANSNHVLTDLITGARMAEGFGYPGKRFEEAMRASQLWYLHDKTGGSLLELLQDPLVPSDYINFMFSGSAKSQKGLNYIRQSVSGFVENPVVHSISAANTLRERTRRQESRPLPLLWQLTGDMSRRGYLRYLQRRGRGVSVLQPPLAILERYSLERKAMVAEGYPGLMAHVDVLRLNRRNFPVQERIDVLRRDVINSALEMETVTNKYVEPRNSGMRYDGRGSDLSSQDSALLAFDFVSWYPDPNPKPLTRPPMVEEGLTWAVEWELINLTDSLLNVDICGKKINPGEYSGTGPGPVFNFFIEAWSRGRRSVAIRMVEACQSVEIDNVLRADNPVPEIRTSVPVLEFLASISSPMAVSVPEILRHLSSLTGYERYLPHIVRLGEPSFDRVDSLVRGSAQIPSEKNILDTWKQLWTKMQYGSPEHLRNLLQRISLRRGDRYLEPLPVLPPSKLKQLEVFRSVVYKHIAEGDFDLPIKVLLRWAMNTYLLKAVLLAMLLQCLNSQSFSSEILTDDMGTRRVRAVSYTSEFIEVDALNKFDFVTDAQNLVMRTLKGPGLRYVSMLDDKLRYHPKNSEHQLVTKGDWSLFDQGSFLRSILGMRQRRQGRKNITEERRDTLTFETILQSSKESSSSMFRFGLSDWVFLECEELRTYIARAFELLNPFSIWGPSISFFYEIRPKIRKESRMSTFGELLCFTVSVLWALYHRGHDLGNRIGLLGFVVALGLYHKIRRLQVREITSAMETMLSNDREQMLLHDVLGSEHFMNYYQRVLNNIVEQGEEEGDTTSTMTREKLGEDTFGFFLSGFNNVCSSMLIRSGGDIKLENIMNEASTDLLREVEDMIQKRRRALRSPLPDNTRLSLSQFQTIIGPKLFNRFLMEEILTAKLQVLEASAFRLFIRRYREWNCPPHVCMPSIVTIKSLRKSLHLGSNSVTLGHSRDGDIEPIKGQQYVCVSGLTRYVLYKTDNNPVDEEVTPVIPNDCIMDGNLCNRRDALGVSGHFRIRTRNFQYEALDVAIVDLQRRFWELSKGSATVVRTTNIIVTLCILVPLIWSRCVNFTNHGALLDTVYETSYMLDSLCCQMMLDAAFIVAFIWNMSQALIWIKELFEFFGTLHVLMSYLGKIPALHFNALGLNMYFLVLDDVKRNRIICPNVANVDNNEQTLDFESLASLLCLEFDYTQNTGMRPLEHLKETQRLKPYPADGTSIWYQRQPLGVPGRTERKARERGQQSVRTPTRDPEPYDNYRSDSRQLLLYIKAWTSLYTQWFASSAKLFTSHGRMEKRLAPILLAQLVSGLLHLFWQFNTERPGFPGFCCISAVEMFLLPLSVLASFHVIFVVKVRLTIRDSKEWLRRLDFLVSQPAFADDHDLIAQVHETFTACEASEIAHPLGSLCLQQHQYGVLSIAAVGSVILRILLPLLVTGGRHS